MTGVLVDFPALEAMALVKRLSGDGGMTAAECDAAQRAHQRIASALQLDPTLNYQPGLQTIAEELVGEVVRVKRHDGRVLEGELEKVTGFRSIFVKDDPFSHPVNLSLVKSIEPVRAEVAA